MALSIPIPYWFAVFFTVVFFGTYLLQGLILATVIVIRLTGYALWAAFGRLGLLVFGVWWLFDPQAARQSWRGETARAAPLWARELYPTVLSGASSSR